MKIKLIGNYRNINLFIPEGEYDSKDAALGGLSQYLLDNGHAVITEADVPKPAPAKEVAPKEDKAKK